MSQLFVSAPPNTHGAFAEEVTPPAPIVPEGTGTAVIVAQFPWGPAETLTYPGAPGDFYNTFAPRGFSRTGSGHLSVIRKGWPTLGAVRAKDPTATAATIPLKTAGAVTVITLNLKYPGTDGNSIIATVGAPDDGVSGHVTITVSISSASGTTTEIYRNADYNNATPANPLNITNSILIGSVTVASQGTIANGSTTATGGTDGTTTATHYVGTPGGNDYGLALLEGDDSINHVFYDDPGNSLRAACNSGMLAHVELLGSRVGYINGNSGQTAASAQTDVANYRSTRLVYVDPWAYIYDDTTGALQLAPSACWAASVAAQTSPSVSIAWKADFVSAMLGGIAKLEADRGAFRGQNTANGITTLIKRKKGGFAFEAGKTTSITSGYTNLTRTRTGQYIASSVTESWDEYVDGPNITFYQQQMIDQLEAFMSGMKKAQSVNPAVMPYVRDYKVLPPNSANTEASEALGDYYVPLDVQIGSNMERIYLAMQYGEGVNIVAA